MLFGAVGDGPRGGPYLLVRGAGVRLRAPGGRRQRLSFWNPRFRYGVVVRYDVNGICLHVCDHRAVLKSKE